MEKEERNFIFSSDCCLTNLSIWIFYFLLFEFSYHILTAGNFSFTERITVKYAGAAAMYFVSKNLKKKYNITDERAALYEAAETWVNALNGRDFLGMQQYVLFLLHNLHPWNYSLRDVRMGECRCRLIYSMRSHKRWK